MISLQCIIVFYYRYIYLCSFSSPFKIHQIPQSCNILQMPCEEMFRPSNRPSQTAFGKPKTYSIGTQKTRAKDRYHLTPWDSGYSLAISLLLLGGKNQKGINKKRPTRRYTKCKHRQILGIEAARRTIMQEIKVTFLGWNCALLGFFEDDTLGMGKWWCPWDGRLLVAEPAKKPLKGNIQ